MLPEEHNHPKGKFSLGQIVATPNALSVLEQDEILTALARHVSGDWGELGTEDKQANDLALTESTCSLASYQTAKGIKFWIITEHDRSVTTVLLPEDY